MTQLDRRGVLERALILAGAAITPGFSLEALAREAAAGDRLLGAKDFALLSSVADTIVPRTDTPGAVEAGVPKLLDALLRSWASPARRKTLTGALRKIDGLAREKENTGFAELPPEKRVELLAAHDVAALKPVPVLGPDPAAALKRAPSVVDPNHGRVRQQPIISSPFSAEPAVADPGYAKLKELIVVLFYLSETALTTELRYEHSPGEWQPSIPITPETRPWGGPGLV